MNKAAPDGWQNLRHKPDSFTMSSMTSKFSNSGAINILLVPLLLVVLLFFIAAGFGLWAYSSREDYRTNVNAKIATAVKTAKQQEDIVKDKQHAEADKSPLKTYVGPEQYGSLHVSYPKTWSGYVLDSGNGSQPLNGYFQPGTVPNVADQSSTFALRIQVVNQSYAAVVTQLNQAVVTKALTATAYALPRVPSVVGIRYDGAINAAKKINGSMVVLPLRDKTVEISTESPIYAPDFNSNILPNITFSP